MSWSCTLLRAGSFRLDGGGMFGVVPKALWSKMTDAADDNTIPLQCNCLLLEQGGTRVLVETGNGDKWSDKERSIYHLEERTVLDGLAEHNVDPGSIDHVVLTHLHFDHAGGMTRPGRSGDGADKDNAVTNFPNAAVHVQTREWADADANTAVMSRTYLRSHLDPIATQIQKHDGVSTILDGIRVMPVPGHTWGQQAVLIDGTHGTICFPGDVVPTVNHAGSAFNMGYDVEPYTNMKTKQSLFTRAHEEQWTIVLDHEPGNPVVRVTPHAKRAGVMQLTPSDPADAGIQ